MWPWDMRQTTSATASPLISDLFDGLRYKTESSGIHETGIYGNNFNLTEGLAWCVPSDGKSNCLRSCQFGLFQYILRNWLFFINLERNINNNKWFQIIYLKINIR